MELDLQKPDWCFLSKDDTAANTDITFDFEKIRLFLPVAKINEKLWLKIEDRLAKEAMRQFHTIGKHPLTPIHLYLPCQDIVCNHEMVENVLDQMASSYSP